MSRARRYDRARERMEDALRAELPPEPRWDALERELFARLDRAAPSRPRAVAPPSSLRQVVTLAAAAAAVAIGVAVAGSGGVVATGVEPRTRDLAAIPRLAGERGALDFRALRPGDAVEATDTEVSVADEGSVRWTLAPGSRAVVRNVGKHGVDQVIALERGSVEAEVAPRDPAEGLVEAFAVEVDGTRVAVHGTLFTVARVGDRVEVDVEHGSVAVGPAGYRGATTAHLLVAPSRGSFSLDGGHDARLLPRGPRLALGSNGAAAPHAAAASPAAPERPPAVTAPGAGVAPAAAAPRASAAADRLDLPETLAAAPNEDPRPSPPAGRAPATMLTEPAVQASLLRCFAAEIGAGSSSVHRSIASTLRITARPDGTIASIRFDPPLRPALQACAEALYAGRFASGPKQIAIPLVIKE